MASPAIGISEVDKNSAAASPSPLSRIRELLALCSRSATAGDVSELDSLVTELVNSVNLLLEDIALDPCNDDMENDIFQALSEILAFLSSPLVDRAAIDALSFELPKVISKFANISSRCLEIVNSIVDRFVTICSPRDMLSILCEALAALRGSIEPLVCYAPLFHGLCKVFPSIQRRHYEQLKAAVPVVVNVLKDISLETEVEVEDLFDKAFGIALSIRDVCSKLKNQENVKLRSLFGLFVLQMMALLSVSIRDKVETSLPLVIQLAPLLTDCGFTYLGLITGHDPEKEINIVAGDDDEDDESFISSLPDFNLGASLSIIWAKISNHVTQAAHADLANAINELQSNQVKRWQAYGMLKYVISSGNLIWEFRRHAIELLLEITEGITSSQCNDEPNDCSQYTPSVYAALQALTLLIMHAPNRDLRKKTFDALKRVLSDIPTSQKFDILRALVTNSQSPSMTAILLDLVKDNVSKKNLQDRNRECVDRHVLELVELVLRPPHGGPPILPEQSDAILAALNLYRFVLLVESNGKRRGASVVLTKKNLQKAYEEWLLPLRALVNATIVQNSNNMDDDDDDDGEYSLHMVCSLNPIQLVLYRCIELVESELKTSP